MSTTKVPNFLVSPLPPSASETSTALDTKLNISDYNTALTSVNNRLDTIDNTFNNYLPLSGGTITGPVYLQNNTTSKNDGYMLTNDSLNAHYGFTWGKGPGIIFRGFNFSNPTAEAGNFAIYARSSTSTNNYILVGRPDGHLMWGTALNSGKEVERVDSTSFTADKGYIKYASGLMICWDKATAQPTASNTQSGLNQALYYSRKAFTYRAAFTRTPIVVPAYNETNLQAPWGHAIVERNSTTGCNVFLYTFKSIPAETEEVFASYIAIGPWK